MAMNRSQINSAQYMLWILIWNFHINRNCHRFPIFCSVFESPFGSPFKLIYVFDALNKEHKQLRQHSISMSKLLHRRDGIQSLWRLDIETDFADRRKHSQKNVPANLLCFVSTVFSVILILYFFSTFQHIFFSFLFVGLATLKVNRTMGDNEKSKEIKKHKYCLRFRCPNIIRLIEKFELLNWKSNSLSSDSVNRPVFHLYSRRYSTLAFRKNRK